MYNKIIMQRFLNPLHSGLIKGADTTGSAKSEQCGDILKIYLMIEHNKIVQAKFKAFGSPITICAGDLTAEMLVGKTIEDALLVKNKDIEDMISSGVPNIKLHASVMAEEVIKEAILEYQKKQNKKIKS